MTKADVARIRRILEDVLQRSIDRLHNEVMRQTADRVLDLFGDQSDADRLRAIEDIHKQMVRHFERTATQEILAAYKKGADIAATALGVSPRSGVVDSKAMGVLVRDMVRDFTAGLAEGRRQLGSLFVLSKQGILTETELSGAVLDSLTRKGTAQEAIKEIAQRLRKKLHTSPITRLSPSEQHQLINSFIAKARRQGVRGAALDDMRKMLLDDGFIRIVNKNGHYMHFRVSYYAELVARTRIGNAQNIGVMDMSAAHGGDLFGVTAHNSPNFCHYFEGRIYTTNPEYVGLAYRNKRTGTIENIEMLSGSTFIQSEGINISHRPVYHINCRHRLYPTTFTAAEWRFAYTTAGRDLPSWLDAA